MEKVNKVFGFLVDGFIFGCLTGGFYVLTLFIPAYNYLPLILMVYLDSVLTIGAYNYITSGHKIKHPVRFVLSGLAFGGVVILLYLAATSLPFFPLDLATWFIPVFFSSAVAFYVRAAYFLSIDLVVEQRQANKIVKEKVRQ